MIVDDQDEVIVPLRDTKLKQSDNVTAKSITVKYLTKQQRQKAKKVQQETEEQTRQEAQKNIKKLRNQFERSVDEERRKERKKKERNNSSSGSNSENDGNRRQKYSRSRSSSQDQQRDKKHQKGDTRSSSDEKDDDRKWSRSGSKQKDQYQTSNTRAQIPVSHQFQQGLDPEVAHIKMHYLGLQKEKKKLLKPSEQFKNNFNFEWDQTEDTSIDYNPLYANRHDPSLMFGRGTKGGFDITEQKKASINYENLVHQLDPEAVPVPEKQEVLKDRNDIGDLDHWSHKKTSQMSERDWRIFREDNEIIIKGGKVPKPVREWSEGNLPGYMLQSIKRSGYDIPTPIQMQALPIGMNRQDLIGIAPTGSGQSAAYLIPMIIYLRSLPVMDDEIAQDGPYALILAPTRELASQIDIEFQQLTVNMKLKSVLIVGGTREEKQVLMVKRGCEVIIGTPGRIKFALEQKIIVLEQCSWVIIDQADKMIDSSHGTGPALPGVTSTNVEADVTFILDRVGTIMKAEDQDLAEKQERQARAGQQIYRVTHLFSATMPNEIEKLAQQYMRAFCYISIGEPGGGKKDIQQNVEYLSEGAKKNKLTSILNQAEAPIIIFANEKKSVEFLAQIVEGWGWRTIYYHGGKTQQQRQSAVDGFKAGQYDILIATDVAGRGLHVDGVKMVINFDCPQNIRDFVHRTGRTGRAGNKGIAYTFVTSSDEAIFYDLREFLRKNEHYVPQQIEDHPASRIKPGSFAMSEPRRKQVLYAQ